MWAAGEAEADARCAIWIVGLEAVSGRPGGGPKSWDQGAGNLRLQFH